MLVLPYLIYWISNSTHRSYFNWAWIASFVGTRLLARQGGSASLTDAMGWIRKLLGFSSSVRNAILAACVIVVLLGGGVLICAVITQHLPTDGTQLIQILLALGVSCLIIFVGLGFVLNFNNLSLHYFYRDRLVETYLQTDAPNRDVDYPKVEVSVRDDAEMALKQVHGFAPKGENEFRACVTAAPYHLIVASLNLTSSRDVTRRDRKSDEFVFSKLYCGADTTGYMRTEDYRGGETKLARAMTISGAAASSAMGQRTFFAEAFALTLFNVRLGQWMENPRHQGGEKTHRNERGVFWPFYLFREMLGSTDANDRLIHLSDGGHTGDNLGIVPLLRRRCAVIIACDAEADPSYTFGSLAEALRQIYVDENIKVDLEIDAIRPTPETGFSRSHYVVGKIRYPKKGDRPMEVGWLVILKASMTGEELARIKNYKRENPIFPQQTTADQFFDDDQFESYRELGYHVAKSALNGVPGGAWRPQSGEAWMTTWNTLYASFSSSQAA